jgi:anti-anti-sigma regulatory factor
MSLDDDTSKEIQEILVKQQVAKTAQDIFIGIRFVEFSSQSAHDDF